MLTIRRTLLSKNGVVQRGPLCLFWNSLDDSFKSLRTLSTFTKKLKLVFLMNTKILMLFLYVEIVTALFSVLHLSVLSSHDEVQVYCYLLFKKIKG